MSIENIEQGTLPAHIKAVVALTSWKKRINTVGLTIFNLRCVCGKDFHIVLTLAEEEFPRKERELPEDLMRMNRVGIFEILWVKKNWKSFKKILFTMQKYPSKPIISADDDCIYRFNYAAELLGHLPKDTCTCVTYWCSKYRNTNYYNTAGYATCFSSNYFNNAIRYISDRIMPFNEDDMLYLSIRIKENIQGCICLNKSYTDVAIEHDGIEPLHNMYSRRTKDERDNQIDNLVDILKMIR